MDLSQIVILLVIVVISVILVIIGLQIISLLKDVKETLRKADLVLEDVGFLTRSLTRGGTALSNMVSSLQSGMQLVGLFTKLVAPKIKK